MEIDFFQLKLVRGETNTEVKQKWAQKVLGWETTREILVLLVWTKVYLLYCYICYKMSKILSRTCL